MLGHLDYIILAGKGKYNDQRQQIKMKRKHKENVYVVITEFIGIFFDPN